MSSEASWSKAVPCRKAKGVTGWGVIFLGVVGVAVTAGGQDRLELAPTIVGGQTSGHG